MAEIIRMPKMSDTMTDGVIAAWHKKVGDKVKAGDLLAEVETDKATMELESYYDGTLLYIGINEKDSVPVDGLIAIVGKDGEDVQALINGTSGGAAAPTAPDAPVAKAEEAAAPTATAAKVEPAPAQATSTSVAVSVGDVKASVIRMPKMSDTMTEGTIATWLKKVGDAVKPGDVLAEVETDKATMELEAYEAGTLLYIGVEAGSAIAVDGILAIVGESGADYKALLNGGSAPAAPAPETPALANAETIASAAPTATAVAMPAARVPAQAPAASSNGADDRTKASPLAKKLAEDKGIDIHAVQGTGEGGRIVRRDIETFVPSALALSAAAPAASPAAPAAKAAPAPASTNYAPGVESYDEVPVSQMRKVIARRLGESLFTAPHFYLTMEIDMTKAVAARASINEFTGTKISFNDMVLKATAAALKKHPKVNSSWLGDKIRYNHHVHIGVAVAVEDGLLVPVVRFADAKSLTAIAAEVKDLGAKAKNKQLQPADWEGNTFTISNLGMFGIDEFTAIINPPDACILAVGGIKEAAVVRDGAFAIASLMKVTLSCDHRVVDGAMGSAFLQTLKGLLEDPVRILA